MYHDGGEGIRESQDRTWDTRINYDDQLDFWALSLRIANFNHPSQMNNALFKEGREDSEEGK